MSQSSDDLLGDAGRRRHTPLHCFLCFLAGQGSTGQLETIYGVLSETERVVSTANTSDSTPLIRSF
jgi:hypothetical protein